MIFQHTLDKVLNGEKTQTRRLAKPLESLIMLHDLVTTLDMNTGKIKDITAVYTASGREKWSVGKTYSVQPGRGKPSIARILLTRIRYEDVREITTEDVIAEGFQTKSQFLEMWCEMHDNDALDMQTKRSEQFFYPLNALNKGYADVNTSIIGQFMSYSAESYWVEHDLPERPDELYRAWVLDFERI